MKLFLSKYFNILISSINKSGLEHDMKYWREKICNYLFYLFSGIGIIIYIPSTVMAVKDGLPEIAVADTIAYSICLILTFYKKINPLVRAVSGALLFYLLGFLLLFFLGPSGAGGYWLFSTVIIAAFLIGNWGAIAAHIIVSFTMIAFSFVIYSGTVPWAAPGGISVRVWIIKTLSVIFLNTVIVIANFIFVQGFETIFQEAKETRNATIIGLAKLAEHRDTDTGEHLKRIKTYTFLLGKELAKMPQYNGYISKEYLEDLKLSSILHDIGKVGVQDAILLKPGKLSKSEFEEIKKHPVIGGQVINEIENHINGRSLYELAREVALFHHEKWDGSGYPKGLKGQEIPLSARIVALVDVYDAITSKRPYKDAVGHDETVQIIIQGKGTHFDPDIVEAFLNISDTFLNVSYEQD